MRQIPCRSSWALRWLRINADSRSGHIPHLEAALKAYKQALALDKQNLVIRFGLAWLTEQAGMKDDAVKQYRAIAADVWGEQQNLTHTGLSGRTLKGEIASCLIPLLAPDKDKREIGTLRDHVATLGKLPSVVTPIAVPLADSLTAIVLEAPHARFAGPFRLTGCRSCG